MAGAQGKEKGKARPRGPVMGAIKEKKVTTEKGKTRGYCLSMLGTSALISA